MPPHKKMPSLKSLIFFVQKQQHGRAAKITAGAAANQVPAVVVNTIAVHKPLVMAAPFIVNFTIIAHPSNLVPCAVAHSAIMGDAAQLVAEGIVNMAVLGNFADRMAAAKNMVAAA
jgi:hypothetical protein